MENQDKESVEAGVAHPEKPYYQLQRVDEAAKFESDEAAVRAAVRHALKGDPYAVEQLRQARCDLLVRKIAEESGEDLSFVLNDPAEKPSAPPRMKG